MLAAQGNAGTPRLSTSTPRSARTASANLQFFGASGDRPNISPWFHPEDLGAPDFSADAYVAELRQYAPLENLAEEFEAYLGTLKTKLVEVINEDYNDFVNLSTRLVNVDGAVLRMQKPLQEVGQKLAEVQQEFQGELDALQDGLKQRQEIAAARGLLELMQSTAHTMTKVESLLAEIENVEEQDIGAAGEALDGRCRMLERLASEISRLNFYAAKGQELPFIQSLRPQIGEAREKLRFRLAAALKAALVEGHASARQHCLLAFAAINDPSGAELVVREVKVRGLVLAIVDQTLPSAARPADALPQVVEGVVARVGEALGPLLAAAHGSEAALQGFNFLGNSLLAEVDHVIEERIPGATSPGVPATFVRNYKAALTFLDRLEGLCETKAAVSAFRSCPAYSSFMRRWKLSIYFSTRFQEIAGALENSISGSSDILADESQAGQQPHLQLRCSYALLECLQRTVAEEVFLPALADKFFRLLLQLLARYQSWVRLGTQASPQPPSSTPQVAQDTEHARQWGGNPAAELLASAQADLDTLASWLLNFGSNSLQTFTATLPNQAAESVRAVFQEAVEKLQGESGPLIAQVVVQIADKCAEGLQQIRGITAMYRMSARPPPTRPSHYVGSILLGLKQFHELKNARALQEHARLQISKGVVAGVAARFAGKAAELLDALRKTESSLNRIRHNRPQESHGLSDIDKISLQLHLDVQEFGKRAGDFGVDPRELPVYVNLWRIVAPADKADAIDL